MNDSTLNKKVELEKELSVLEKELLALVASSDVAISEKFSLLVRVGIVYQQLMAIEKFDSFQGSFEEFAKSIPSPEAAAVSLRGIVADACEKSGSVVSDFFGKCSDRLRNVNVAGKGDSVDAASSEEEKVDVSGEEEKRKKFQNVIDLLKAGQKQHAYADLLMITETDSERGEEEYFRVQKVLDAADNLIKADKEAVALEVLSSLFIK